VIGRPLVARLLAARHHVGVLARSDAAIGLIAAMGAEPVEGDALNSRSLRNAVKTYAPDLVINQLTSLPRSLLNPRQGLRSAKLTNRLRTEAAPTLVEAAIANGVGRIIIQSIAFAQRPGTGVRVEADPLYLDAPSAHGKVVRAVAAAESATLDAADIDGVVLRYGAFYGPDTYFAADEAYPRMLRRGLLPIIGEGRGVWGLVHVDDAVDATLAAIDGPAGVFNICDDAPVEAAELIHWMAYAIGSKQPRTVAARWFATGPATILRYLIDEQPAVSSERTRKILRWTPRHDDWRDHLARVLRGE
jgi:nucleoside-diphosphate-sugar epimerase